MADKMYVGDVGTVITVETNSVLTGASATNLKILKADGTEATWVGAINGTTQIDYTIKADDLSVAGNWFLNSFVTFASGDQWTGETVKFPVYNPFDRIPA